MRVSSLAAALFVLVISAGAAIAAFCPRCDETIGGNRRYCDACAAKIAAEENQAATEAELVQQLRDSREAYRRSLEELRDYYRSRGDFANYEKAVHELEDVALARQYFYQHWEDTLGELEPARRIREAELLFEEADKLRRSINPFGIRRRQLKMIDLYRQILELYPDSELVDTVAFRLGQVYEDIGGPETERAARFYERSFRWNPNTSLPGRFRAARIYDRHLRNFSEAMRLYELAAAHEADEELQKEAAIRLEELRREHGR